MIESRRSSLPHLTAVLAALLLAVLPSVRAVADQGSGPSLGEACRAELQGDHTQAIELYEAAAREGVREAMFALGRLWRDGLGVTADSETAAAWFLKAAEKGHLLARYEVGMALRDGRGVKADPDLAREWLESAGLRHPDAAYAVFEMEGEPAEKSSWLHRAAELGHAKAMNDLARAYSRGDYGLARSDAESRRWAAQATHVETDEH